MTVAIESTQVTVHESQIRIEVRQAISALQRVRGERATRARTRLRFGPGRTCEQLARVLDAALIQAEQQGLSIEGLVLVDAVAVAAEEIVRVRRKAHGVADFISSATSDVTVVLRPEGAGPTVVSPIEQRSGVSDSAPELTSEVKSECESECESGSELAIREALYEVIDPDLGVNIVDLGFVRRVRLGADGVAELTMTLTSAACPLTAVMEGQIRTALAGTEFLVRWEWVPAWRPSDISEPGRDQLRAVGFTAF